MCAVFDSLSAVPEALKDVVAEGKEVAGKIRQAAQRITDAAASAREGGSDWQRETAVGDAIARALAATHAPGGTCSGIGDALTHTWTNVSEVARAWNTTTECIAKDMTQTLSRLEKEGGKAAKKAILGEKNNTEPDDETASNLLFVEMSKSTSNLAPNNEAMGKDIAAGLMWLCNVNSASGGNGVCGHASNADCPCAPKGANSSTTLASAGNWKALKTPVGASDSEIAVNWDITKKACSVATGTKHNELDNKAEAAAHLEHALRALDTRMHDDGKTSGKNTLCLGITHADGCDGGDNGNACVCYAQTKIAKFAQIPWVKNAMLAAQKLGDAKETLRSMQALQQRAQALALETTWTSARTHPPTHDTRTTARTRSEEGESSTKRKATHTTLDRPEHNAAGATTQPCSDKHPQWDAETKTCETKKRAQLQSTFALLPWACLAHWTLAKRNA
ncbi:Trypanosomal VSG domain [Trypanosoma vivax]|nr:Trypanosomal VSG domain [Trypanosoma vivax]